MVDVTSPAYIAGCVSQDSHAIVMSSDLQVKKIIVQNGKTEMETKFDAVPKVMTPLPSGKILVGLGDGNVECRSGDSLTREFCSNENEVTSMQYTASDRWISASREGLCFSAAVLVERRHRRQTTYGYNGISVILKADLDAHLGKINSLEDSIQNLRSEHTTALNLSCSNQDAVKVKVNDKLSLDPERLNYEPNESTNEIRSLGMNH